MSSALPLPKYFTFSQLSKKWGLDETTIETYLLTREISECDMQVYDTKVPKKERYRVNRLMSVLNVYAYNKILHCIENGTLDSHYKSRFSEIFDQDFLFKDWIAYKDLDIDKISVVIPKNAVIAFESKHNINKNVSISKNYLVIALIDSIVAKLYKDNNKIPKYSQVLNSLNDEATKDYSVGKLIKSCNTHDGIVLNDEETIPIGTVKRWLTDIRKKYPNFRKV